MKPYGYRKRRVTTPTYRPNVTASNTAERQSSSRAVDEAVRAFVAHRSAFARLSR